MEIQSKATSGDPQWVCTVQFVNIFVDIIEIFSYWRRKKKTKMIDNQMDLMVFQK